MRSSPAAIVFCVAIVPATGSDATPFIARHGLTSAEYQNAYTSFGSSGYRLIKVSGYEVNNSARFAAFWEKTTGPAMRAHHNQTGAQFLTTFQNNVSDGYRMTYIDSYEVGGKIYYASIWNKEGGPAWKAYIGMTSANYQNKFNTFGNDGYRVTCITGARVNGTDYYAAIWKKQGGPAIRAHHGQSPGAYQTTFSKNLNDGYRPVHVSAWAVGGSSRFASVWEKSGGHPLWARHHMTHGQYQSEFENGFYSGYRIRHVNGYSVNGSPRFLAVWDNCNFSAADLQLIQSKVDAYMGAQGLPGLSIAISRKGKLVFARGYGMADTGAGVIMSPRHQLRNASVSKAMTGLAVMKLVEQGQLSLGDKVFGPGELLGTTYGTMPYSNRVRNITVRHLLTHTSGWSNTNGSGDVQDPMFMSFNNQSDVIDHMIDTRGVASSPGSTYEYLNFGFCVMGRVIERVTGQSYENYVKNAILAPSGITRAGIGNTSVNNKLQDEVTYYPSAAYNLRPRHMDAHGGWVTSPIDLLKLSVRADGYAYPGDMISPASRADLLNGTAANSTYGLGWFTSNSGQGHNGAMRGTIGFLWQQNSGDISIAVIANRRPGSSQDNFAFGARNMVLDIANSVSEWPAYNLFSGSHAPVYQINPILAANLPTDLIFNADKPDTRPIQAIGTSLDRLIVTNPKPIQDKDDLLEARMVTDRSGKRLFEMTVPTEDGKVYSVEQSGDLSTWREVKRIEGTGDKVIVNQEMTRSGSAYFRLIADDSASPEREFEMLPERFELRPDLIPSIDPIDPIGPIRVEQPVDQLRDGPIRVMAGGTIDA